MSERPNIDVRPQVALPLTRVVGLCVKGIRHRLFRSLLTTVVVVLAVAFFMFLLTSSVFARSVGTGVRSELADLHRADQAFDLWSGKPNQKVWAVRLAEADARRIALYVAVSGLPESDVAALAAASAREAKLIAFFNRIDPGIRAALIKRTPNERILDLLADPGLWNEFVANLGQIRAVRLPMEPAEAQAAASGAVVQRERVRDFAATWSGRIDALCAHISAATATSDRDGWAGWLAEGDPARIATFAAVLKAHGFAAAYPEGEVALVAHDLRTTRARQRAYDVLSSDEGTKAWNHEFRANPPVDEKMADLDDPRAARVIGAAVSAEDLRAVAARARQEQLLAKRESRLTGAVPEGGAWMSPRQAFLVAISFVVCMVGIANAMLMAITERFREIATMKCLGATDGFILQQFLTEAALQGLTGGAAGMVVGLLLAVIKDGALYGGHLLTYFPVLGALACAGICILAGLLLATLASIYPSLKASSMAPMEAMRVE